MGSPSSESAMQQRAPAIRILSMILLSAFSACSGEKSNAESVKQRGSPSFTGGRVQWA